ncbi:menaquinone biosynthesis protein [Desulfobacterales bacterium HSG16]|nr:menaquinone biosynthesis protein [Desulfobacterales bacterium HSG16]
MELISSTTLKIGKKTDMTQQLSRIFANIGRISYLNVAPVYYGFDNGQSCAGIKFSAGPPAVLNKMLERGELDISPVSSAAYARNQHKWLLLPDLSISCIGKVMSVLLVSRYPVSELSGKPVVLTEESATAAALTRLLLSSRGIKPKFETGRIRHTGDLDNKAAALVIGDAALKENWNADFPHVHDLGKMWRNQTGLPFVFALWAVRKSFAEKRPEIVWDVMERFYRSRQAGYENIKKILPITAEKLGISHDICSQYYQHLYYDLDVSKTSGLETFFNGLYRQNLICEPVKPAFFASRSARFVNCQAA